MTSKFSGLALAVDKPARMTILHPITRQPIKDGDGKEAYVDLYSSDSEAARKHQRAVTKNRLALRDRGKVTPEQLEVENSGLYAALTAGWYLVSLAGAPIDVPCTVDSASELYANPELAWLREQVDAFVVDRGNFLKASSEN
jgi:hypothetical protein